MGRLLPEVSGAAGVSHGALSNGWGNAVKVGAGDHGLYCQHPHFSSIPLLSFFIRWRSLWRKAVAFATDAGRRAGGGGLVTHHAVPPTPGPAGGGRDFNVIYRRNVIDRDGAGGAL